MRKEVSSKTEMDCLQGIRMTSNSALGEVWGLAECEMENFSKKINGDSSM